MQSSLSAPSKHASQSLWEIPELDQPLTPRSRHLSMEYTGSKDPDAGKDGRQEEKGVTEDEMVGWHHRLNGHEFEQAPAVVDGQGGLARCSPWGRKESDMTERLNSTVGTFKCWLRSCPLHNDCSPVFPSTEEEMELSLCFFQYRNVW